MKSIPVRAQLGLVALGYALVLAASVMLVGVRYIMYLRDPQGTAAAGGMYAAGDLMLAVFIVCMLLVPTFFLALIARNFEELYTRYSRVLFAVSLTAPLCLAVLSIPAVAQSKTFLVLGEICMYRLCAMPFLTVGFLISRLLAGFDRAKRLTLYALLIEVVTLVATIALFLF